MHADNKSITYMGTLIIEFMTFSKINVSESSFDPSSDDPGSAVGAGV